jgi:hypothetical protein
LTWAPLLRSPVLSISGNAHWVLMAIPGSSRPQNLTHSLDAWVTQRDHVPVPLEATAMNTQDSPAPTSLVPTLDNEKLLQVLFELASEVWVLRDRLSLLEHSMVARQVLRPGELDAPLTDEEAKKRLGAERALFISRLLTAASPTVQN